MVLPPPTATVALTLRAAHPTRASNGVDTLAMVRLLTTPLRAAILILLRAVLLIRSPLKPHLLLLVLVPMPLALRANKELILAMTTPRIISSMLSIMVSRQLRVVSKVLILATITLLTMHSKVSRVVLQALMPPRPLPHPHNKL